MYDLNNFTLLTMAQCSSMLRSLGNGAETMVQATDRIVRHLYDNLHSGPGGERSCALVRFYKTHPLGELEPELQEVARSSLAGHPESPTMKCLTLLASVGDLPEWNDRKTSRGHRAIPLPSADVVDSAPMIAQLIHQFGLDVNTLLKPSPELLIHLEQRTYNIFFVPEAAGSPCVPAQDFVAQHGIKSVLGFGGMLPMGDLFAVIMFTKVAIPTETVSMFKTLALGVKVAIIPFTKNRVFA